LVFAWASISAPDYDAVSRIKIMTDITKRTMKAIETLFSSEEQGIVKDELELNYFTNVAGCNGWSASQMERIWFAVLKSSNGQLSEFKTSIKLANTDFRDLLMIAEFGEDLEAHNKWFKQLN